MLDLPFGFIRRWDFCFVTNRQAPYFVAEGLSSASQSMDPDQEELFQSIILDHDTRPRNCFHMDDATHVQMGLNPICGDRFVIFLDVEGEHIRRASFQGRGCTLSKASTSIMVARLPGKSIQEARAARTALREALETNSESDHEPLGELEALMGVREHPSRISCVMLAWDAMAAAIETEDAPSS